MSQGYMIPWHPLECGCENYREVESPQHTQCLLCGKGSTVLRVVIILMNHFKVLGICVCMFSFYENIFLNFLCAIRHTSLGTALVSFEECVQSLTHPHSHHAGQLGHLKSLPFLFFLSVATVTLRSHRSVVGLWFCLFQNVILVFWVCLFHFA